MRVDMFNILNRSTGAESEGRAKVWKLLNMDSR